MQKKALKYFIIFFVVPLVVSIIIGIASNFSKNSNNTSDFGYHEVDYNNINNNSVKKNNTYIYLSVFCFVVMGFGVLLYINKKEDF